MRNHAEHFAFTAGPGKLLWKDKKCQKIDNSLRRAAKQWKLTLPRCSATPTIAPARGLSPRGSAAQIAEQLKESGAMQDKDTRLFTMLSDSRAALFAKVLTNRTRHITFVLDGVYGAHNLAAIARSCDAWGVQDLHFITQPDEYLPRRRKGAPEMENKTIPILERFKTEQSVQNVSKNCHKWLTVREYPTAEPCLSKLRRAGYKIYASSLSQDALPIHDVDLSQKCAFVFGNEKHGVTKEAEAQADGFFTIPMMGFVESMNVSVAVATTACLTTTSCQRLLPSSEYFVSKTEMQELAHLWLADRFSVKQAPRPLRVRRDVSKLGHQCEDRIVTDGMFANVEDRSLFGDSYWNLKLRPTGDGGRKLIRDIIRRKVGILGEVGFEKRCAAINFCLGGSHAIACEAALSHHGPSKISRLRLSKYFQLVCDEVSAAYKPYFDQFGVPSLPAYAQESTEIFDNLQKTATQLSRTLWREIAADLLMVHLAGVHDIISAATPQDVANCIADTLRCGKMKTAELQHIACRKIGVLEELSEYTDDERANHNGLRGRGQKKPLDYLDHDQREVLHVCLRVHNTALMCSEVYQTIWDRHSKNSVSRIHSARFGLLESVLSDIYSEVALLNSSYQASLSRAMSEWYRVLGDLQTKMIKNECGNG